MLPPVTSPVLRRALAALAASALVLAPVVAGAATRGAAVQPRAHVSARAPFAYRHVFVVVMENIGYQSALSASAYGSLAHRYAYATDMYASSHPSLPNYLELTSGSTHGIASDCLTCYVRSNNLGAQLSAAHVSWDDYTEAVPRRCYLGTSTGEYAAKHNPFRYYDDIRASRGLCAHLETLTALTTALPKAASAVPAYSFVTPNLCHDGHDCAPTVAAAWLTGFLAKVTASAAYKDHGLVIVTWDEGSDSDTSSISPTGAIRGSGGGGHILTLFVARGVPAGTIVHQPLDHAALLATVEHNFHLAPLGAAAAWTGHTLSLR